MTVEQAVPGSPPKQKILVVEDDINIARVLQLELEHEGFAVEVCGDGVTAIERALKQPDLIILDILIPRIDGLEVCRRVRKQSSVPIIMLTAKDAVPDRITGLDTGANDYLSKPFSIEELLARVRVQLREREPGPRTLAARDLTLNRDTREVTRNGRRINLTAKEFSLLEFLLMYPNKVHTRDEIFNSVWGSDFLGESNLIDVYIRYLRNKVDVESEEKLIQTVRGVGYSLRT
ncbi:MAG: DNA-binding response regulator [Candidatus Eremiobacter antarcticus]|nr:response regulator transcription factor [Candidatus Eremiobacteraeota bacterium]MBC5808067.1 response regulator transcription factor [Candidatus Eremiobacteraeota bacterium]PZR63469.1 MAG: DNA-binding response regulator [Candidatus Eremiobacter sp. RRmetagenome_bin22]